MSALGGHLVRYLQIRRALGYQLIDHGRLLEKFVAHLEAAGEPVVTVRLALGWAAAPREASPALIARRLSAVRAFATYLAAFEPDTEIPPANLFAGGGGRVSPYIYSEAEIVALMAAAGRLAPPLRAASMRTLIGLLAATGLRTGEAWRLDRRDVDLGGGSVTIRCSKYGKTRRLPLQASTITALGQYARRRLQWCPHPACEAFLLTPAGRRLGPSTSRVFNGLLAQVGISVPAGRRHPRLYDLRHTFAVATLTGWHAEGVQVQPRLPMLSAYLGHDNPAHTYWYLQAVPELMGVVAGRLEQFLAGQR